MARRGGLLRHADGYRLGEGRVAGQTEDGRDQCDADTGDVEVDALHGCSSRLFARLCLPSGTTMDPRQVRPPSRDGRSTSPRRSVDALPATGRHGRSLGDAGQAEVLVATTYVGQSE